MTLQAYSSSSGQAGFRHAGILSAMDPTAGPVRWGQQTKDACLHPVLGLADLSGRKRRELSHQLSGPSTVRTDTAHLIGPTLPGCWPPADIPVLLSRRKAGSVCGESEVSTSGSADIMMPSSASDKTAQAAHSQASTADSWQVSSSKRLGPRRIVSVNLVGPFFIHAVCAQAAQRSKQSSALPPPARCSTKWQSGYWAAALALEACLNLPWCSQKDLLNSINAVRVLFCMKRCCCCCCCCCGSCLLPWLCCLQGDAFRAGAGSTLQPCQGFNCSPRAGLGARDSERHAVPAPAACAAVVWGPATQRSALLDPDSGTDTTAHCPQGLVLIMLLLRQSATSLRISLPQLEYQSAAASRGLTQPVVQLSATQQDVSPPGSPVSQALDALQASCRQQQVSRRPHCSMLIHLVVDAVAAPLSCKRC